MSVTRGAALGAINSIPMPDGQTLGKADLVRAMEAGAWRKSLPLA